MKRLLSLAAAIAAAIAASAGPASAQQAAPGIGCDGMFPDVQWTSVRTAHPVTIRMSGVTEGLAERYAEEIRGSVDLIEPEFESLAGVELCLFSDKIPLDAQALGWHEGQSLRAASFGSERVVVLSAWTIVLVEPAAARALAHQAQWGRTAGTYPGPFGGAVAGWYQARLADDLDGAHSNMVFARIIRSIPEEIPWTAGPVVDLMMWNPEFQGSGAIGDFVQFVSDEAGLDAVVEPNGDQLAELHAKWYQELLNEARGSDRPTTGWIGGLIVGAVTVLLAMLLALQNRRSKRREHLGPPRTIPVEPAVPVSTGAAPGPDELS